MRVPCETDLNTWGGGGDTCSPTGEFLMNWHVPQPALCWPKASNLPVDGGVAGFLPTWGQWRGLSIHGFCTLMSLTHQHEGPGSPFLTGIHRFLLLL